jgi:hypothetical protein
MLKGFHKPVLAYNVAADARGLTESGGLVQMEALPCCRNRSDLLVGAGSVSCSCRVSQGRYTANHIVSASKGENYNPGLSV